MSVELWGGGFLMQTGTRMTEVTTDDHRETAFVFQRLSVAVRGVYPH